MVWGRGKVGCEGELMCASATTMDKRKQDDHLMIMVTIMMMISQCSVLLYAHVVAVAQPLKSIAVPLPHIYGLIGPPKSA